MAQLYEIRPAPPPVLPTGESSRITSMPILLLNLHAHCNCRCVMCDIWKRRDGGEFPIADLDRHRESLRELGVRHVVLTGGEPLLHREFPSVCAFFRDLGIRVTLLTTGLLLHSSAAHIAAGVDDIILSIDGPPHVHDTIRRIPGAFLALAQGVSTVRTLRPAMPISCRTTVQKRNHRHLRATVDAARSLALDSISFLAADLSSAAFNRTEPWTPHRQNEVALTPDELAELDREIECLIETHQADIRTRFIVEDEPRLRRIAARFREHLEGTPPIAPACNAPWVSTVLDVDGSLRPCFFHPPVASTSTSTLAEALNSQAALIFRAQLDVSTNLICQRCVCSLNYGRPADQQSATFSRPLSSLHDQSG